MYTTQARDMRPMELPYFVPLLTEGMGMLDDFIMGEFLFQLSGRYGDTPVLMTCASTYRKNWGV